MKADLNLHENDIRQKSFDLIAPNYDKYRPGYAPELFDFLISEFNLNSEKHALEVGCGTGQATRGLVDTFAYLSNIL